MRLIAATTALAFATLGGNAIAADSAARELTRADVEAWFDGYVPYAIGTADIAGGVIVVVKGGEIIAQKGYGYADVATERNSRQYSLGEGLVGQCAVERQRILVSHGADESVVIRSGLVSARPRTVIVLARDGEGLVGLLHFVPWGSDGLSLDLMRRDREGPNGVIEAMVAQVAATSAP